MESRDIFRNLSPLDHRYSRSSPELFESLSEILGEEAAIRYCARVEAALLKALVRRAADAGGWPSLTPEMDAAIDAAAAGVDPGQVYGEEEKTRHNIRALVNVMKRHLPAPLRPLLHLGATSADILDTASALRYRDAMRGVILPLLLDLEAQLIRRCREEAETPQVGRTHGQHAVPITFGFALAEYVSRLGESLRRLAAFTADLRGKLAGAVGAYNATSLLVDDPLALERDFLAALGLQASEHSTQLVQPEYLLRLLLEVNVAFGIIANLADDLRNLQRSEIGEVREAFSEGQVGSSTMPQKRNPWNAEHVKSLWKAFAPRVMTFFLDQISDHQRDLTNSASSRFVAEYLAGFALAGQRMREVMEGLVVDRDHMGRNLRLTGDLVYSEAAYVLTALGGDPEAHERLRRATLKAEQGHAPLVEVLRSDPALWDQLSRRLRATLGTDPQTFFSDPAGYAGLAARRARDIAAEHASRVEALRAGLTGDSSPRS